MSSTIPEILYRSWSSTSAGGLKCGKLQQGGQRSDLTPGDLIEEFDQHRQLWDDEPTALISTTSNFLRALHIAYSKAHDGEDPKDITIAFITKPYSSSTKIHQARELLSCLTNDEQELEKYNNEYLLEWEIPGDHIIHTVSLGVLYWRNFDLAAGIPRHCEFPSLSDFRIHIAQDDAPKESYTAGYVFGVAACHFGLRAPVGEIAVQMFKWSMTEEESEGYWCEIYSGIGEGIEWKVAAARECESYEAFGQELLGLENELEVLEDVYWDNIVELASEQEQDPDQNYHWDALTFLQHQPFEGQRRKILDRAKEIYTRIGY